MKKVSILALHLGYGGIEKSVVSLANLLCEKYDVEIAVCYNLYGKSIFELVNRVKVTYLNSMDIVPNHKTLKSSIKKHNPFLIAKELLFSFKVYIEDIVLFFSKYIVCSISLLVLFIIILFGVIIYKTSKVYNISVKDSFKEKLKDKFLMNISGSLVVIGLACICLFATIRINM